jgi:putative transposase
MSRFRLYPTSEQQSELLSHCAHARFVWNPAVEQQNMYTPRKAGIDEGFRIVGPQAQRVERLGKHVGRVWVPKAGWVRFRWTRRVPEAKSYRITRDRAGRWFVAFAAVPEPIAAPATGAEVGVDRGVTVSAALSTGELLSVPGLRPKEVERLARLRRKLPRARNGSDRRAELKAQIARMHAREVDRRKDWVEQTSTRLAREFDLIALEALPEPVNREPQHRCAS